MPSCFFVLILAVIAGPLAQSAPPSESYFSVDPAVRETVAGLPLTLEILARDPLGAPVAGYTGAVTLSATVRAESPKVLMGEWNDGPDAALELVNVSADPVDLTDWSVYSYSDGVLSDLPWGAFVIPGPAVCPPGGIVILRSVGLAPGKFPVFAGGSFPFLPPLNWRSAVVLMDSDGRVVDALPAGPPGLLPTVTLPARIPESVWSGDPTRPQDFSGSVSLQRVGHRNHGSAVDWISASPSIGMRNAGLELPLLPLEKALPISPSVVELAQGRWQGGITITAPASNVVLRVDDGLGHTGASAPVEVHPLPVLTLLMPARLSESDAGSTNGVVSIPGLLETNIVIALRSSDSSEIVVPATVTLLAGTTQTEFEVLHLDDNLLDGTQSVEVTASAPGRAQSVAVVASDDDEPGVLRLSLPVSIVKETFGFPIQAEVHTTRQVDKRVSVELHTDRPDLLLIPSQVEILPGDVRAAWQDPVDPGLPVLLRSAGCHLRPGHSLDARLGDSHRAGSLPAHPRPCSSSGPR